MPDERAIRVTCGEVSLKLTLTSKLLKKSFADAVLTPFIKAYNKREGENWGVDDLVSVTVDETLMTDYSTPASVILLVGETVDAALQFRVRHDVSKPKNALPDDVFSGNAKGWENPNYVGDGELVDFTQDEDERTEVEKLKAARRKARKEREEKQAALDAEEERLHGKHYDVNAMPVVSDVPEGEEEEEAESPVEAAAPAGEASAAAEARVCARLASAEELATGLATGLAEVKRQLAVAEEEVDNDDELEACQKSLAAVLGEIGGLIQGMDDISVGELAVQARDEARARKKAITLNLEGSLLPDAQKLRAAINAALRGD
jgi:hypothetical protein